MKMLSDLLLIFMKNMQIEDLPVNILVNNQLCDIKDFYFDEKIHEYVLELTEGYEYKRGE